MALPRHYWFPPMEPKKPRSPRAGLLLYQISLWRSDARRFGMEFFTRHTNDYRIDTVRRGRVWG